jgi:hypothetical protein
VEHEAETPFDSVESAQQFLELLAEAVEEARSEVTEQIAEAAAGQAERRKQGLQLVSYNLAKLATHLAASRRILNDLRSLRRLLLEERQLERTEAAE